MQYIDLSSFCPTFVFLIPINLISPHVYKVLLIELFLKLQISENMENVAILSILTQTFLLATRLFVSALNLVQ